ncbi:UDP-diphospho-muramoylpentapeptide beta-N-acetylglucosaminyltransferase [Corynebacterium phocae]|uniref:UDP-N-acetylglucosamine--N-acetylmuramyl-(pentapeptide) pyrophosphoryl-undecaprenol N-acetylglucosamine transferase n=1 Tax=Corynebacterium phocae TaxID=161895 RepID=A0A1L7D2B4_9CORY|nr:undecaprenyldiphospho-muramoylpentapeptide beta-N-acetylglucosaminyltransferase [Corynebacterium phocae]APT92230.1 UDP-diphospho-muramoylpentapeptide beta-N-acetylglucosaminyltransferase [Corynebacterium phocae]KAA8725371.1 undecaprenyldiphospho-muramoylpentapeptide beta-N-acetylglucosaminyltransferase [Corynebacterium phocae]
MTNDPISVVIAGGGTAGHIEPALAVAEALKSRHGARVTALGTERGLERDIIPARGVELRLITPVPIPRKPSGDLGKLPFKLTKAVREARKVLKEVKADAVFGTGGYVAAPAYLAAKSMGLPFYVLETNALAGMANKLGVRIGGVGLNATAGSGIPGEVVGIPVRSSLTKVSEGQKENARISWGLGKDRPLILVTGGSQGAQSINRAIAGALPELTRSYQVLHAYGKKNAVPEPAENYVAVPYIEDMASALALADLVICRSGAMTVAEVSAAGVPAIYIPLPIGNGEQALNCQELVEHGAAVLIPDGMLTPELLAKTVAEILEDDTYYQSMANAVESSSAGDVAELLADRIATRISDAKDGK